MYHLVKGAFHQLPTSYQWGCYGAGGWGGLQRYCDITTRSSAVGSPSNNKGLFLSKPSQPSRIPSVLVGWQLSVTA